MIFQLLCNVFTVSCPFCFESYLTKVLGNLAQFPQIQIFKNVPYFH